MGFVWWLGAGGGGRGVFGGAGVVWGFLRLAWSRGVVPGVPVGSMVRGLDPFLFPASLLFLITSPGGAVRGGQGGWCRSTQWVQCLRG